MIVIFWTAPSIQEAEEVAQDLVEKKLVACVSIFPEIFSIYRWEGKVAKEKEVKILFKTKKEHFLAIKDWIEKKASYEVSEILSLKVEDVSLPYASWVNQSLL